MCCFFMWSNIYIYIYIFMHIEYTKVHPPPLPKINSGFATKRMWMYGWQWGGTGPKNMEFSSLPYMILSYPILALSRIMGKTFSPHPRLLGPRKAPLHPVKLYFLLICPRTSTIFSMKPISLIKIYLKLQLNISFQIK